MLMIIIRIYQTVSFKFFFFFFWFFDFFVLFWYWQIEKKRKEKKRTWMHVVIKIKDLAASINSSRLLGEQGSPRQQGQQHSINPVLSGLLWYSCGVIWIWENPKSTMAVGWIGAFVACLRINSKGGISVLNIIKVCKGMRELERKEGRESLLQCHKIQPDQFVVDIDWKPKDWGEVLC